MFMVGHMVNLLTGRGVAVDAASDTITEGSALSAGIVLVEDDETRPDLPCPWCLAPTDESDVSCPSCGEHFGPFSPPRTLG
ncbi:MAG: hypothetical protein PVI35_05510 [Acidimicrobiia bacterium]|jgi:hypothetical protein